MKKITCLIFSFLLLNTISAHAAERPIYLPPQEITCADDGNVLRCSGINHNYLREMVPLDPVELDNKETYQFDSARTATHKRFNAVFIYKNKQTGVRVALYTTYVTVFADVGNQKGKWMSDQSKLFYTCEGNAADCPIAHLPF